jgi:hypothetical protein
MHAVDMEGMRHLLSGDFPYLDVPETDFLVDVINVERPVVDRVCAVIAVHHTAHRHIEHEAPAPYGRFGIWYGVCRQEQWYSGCGPPAQARAR